MSKARICSLLLVLFLWLQPFCYPQNGQSAGSAPDLSIVLPGFSNSLVDPWGNLLLFKTVFTAGQTHGSYSVTTEVARVSQSGTASTQQSYAGTFSSIAAGTQAVYAIVAVPATSTTATLSLVALVTHTGLPVIPLPGYSLSANIELLTVAPGIGSDVIYLVQRTSSGRNALVLSFNGSAFALLHTVSIS